MDQGIDDFERPGLRRPTTAREVGMQGTSKTSCSILGAAVPQVRVVHDAGSRRTGQNRFTRNRIVWRPPGRVERGTERVDPPVCPGHDAGWTVVDGEVVEHPDRVHNFGRADRPAPIGVNRLVTKPGQRTVEVRTAHLETGPEDMACRREQTGLHVEHIEQAVAVHRLQHRTAQPADAHGLRHLTAGRVALFRRGCVQAFPNIAQRGFIKERSEAHIAIMIERGTFGFRKERVVRIEQTRFAQRVFDLGWLQLRIRIRQDVGQSLAESGVRVERCTVRFECGKSPGVRVPGQPYLRCKIRRLARAGQRLRADAGVPRRAGLRELRSAGLPPGAVRSTVSQASCRGSLEWPDRTVYPMPLRVTSGTNSVPAMSLDRELHGGRQVLFGTRHERAYEAVGAPLSPRTRVPGNSPVNASSRRVSIPDTNVCR